MRTLAIAAAFLFAACKVPTEMIVELDTDRSLAELDNYRAIITGPDGRSQELDRLGRVPRTSFGVAPLDGDITRKIRVRIEGRLGETTVAVTERVLTGFVEHQRTTVRIFVAARCTPELPACDSSLACDRCGCVPELLAPDTTIVECTNDAGIDAGETEDAGADIGIDAGEIDAGMEPDGGDAAIPDAIAEVTRFVFGAGSNGEETAGDIAIDHAGNVIVSGSFAGVLSLTSTITLQSTGDLDAFIAKYDRDGRLTWKRRLHGIDRGSTYVHALAIGANNEIYAGGSFQHALSFDDRTLLNVTGASPRGFVLRISSDGNHDHELEIPAGAAGPTAVHDLAVDPASGRVFAGGRFQSANIIRIDRPCIFEQVSETAPVDSDMFLLAATSTLACSWAQSFGSANNDEIFSIAHDGASTVHVAGTYANITSIAGLPDLSRGPGSNLRGAFTAAFSAGDGAAIAAFGIADPRYMEARAIAADPTDVVFGGDLIVGPVTAFKSPPGGTAPYATLGTAPNMMLLHELAPATLEPRALWELTSTSTRGVVTRSITFEPSGDLIAAGDFTGTIELGSNVLVAAARDTFIVRTTRAFEVKRALQLGGELRDDLRAIAVGPNGEVAVLGTFQNTITIDGRPLTTTGGVDLFVYVFEWQ